MPQFIAVAGTGPAQRRLLSDCTAELKKGGCGSVERFSGDSWQDLLDVSRTGGLFEEKRAVIVESADALGTFPEEFFGEIEGSAACVTFLLVFDGDPSKTLPTRQRKEITVRKPAAVPYFFGERVRWVEREARSRKININKGAINLLVEFVDDPEVILSELIKLAAAAGEKLIDEDLASSLIMDDGGRQMLKLLDGICRGETSAVIDALSILRRREVPIKIISALHKRMRMAMYLSLAGEKWREAVETALEITKYQAGLAKKSIDLFPRDALRDFVLAMARESALFKTGLGSGWDGIELEIIRLLASAGKKERHGENSVAAIAG